LRERLEFLLSLVGGLWLIELVNAMIFRQRLNWLGIEPRHLNSLWHIPLAPFLHGNFSHLIANTGPLLMLGWLVLLRGREYFWAVTAICAFASGLGIWLFGSYYSVHLGASGVIFGYVGFLLARGYTERSPSSVLAAIIVALLYGGTLTGVLPGQTRVSWEGHLFGFAGGVWAAMLVNRKR
jgi:membrane associated rhomboid family serine protease